MSYFDKNGGKSTQKSGDVAKGENVSWDKLTGGASKLN